MKQMNLHPYSIKYFSIEVGRRKEKEKNSKLSSETKQLQVKHKDFLIASNTHTRFQLIS